MKQKIDYLFPDIYACKSQGFFLRNLKVTKNKSIINKKIVIPVMMKCYIIISYKSI